MITLYTSYYRDKSSIRQQELEYCLQKNIDNAAIDKIVLLCEDQPVLKSTKIVPFFEGRPTYKRFFNLINAQASQFDISLVANSDIYFDETLRDIRLNGKTAIALSRYDIKNGEAKLHNCSGSQDTWIFQGKVLPIKYSDFNLGIPGCDNRIAWELQRAGYRLINPASAIKSYHYHPSDLHNYHDEPGVVKPHCYIAKPYLFVELT
jgi:hypothetical protein